MTDDSQLLARCAVRVGIADIAVNIVSFEAVTLGDVQGNRKRFARTGAVRRTGGRLLKLFKTGRGNEPLHVGQNLLPIVGKVTFYLGFKPVALREFESCFFIRHSVLLFQTAFLHNPSTYVVFSRRMQIVPL